MTMKHFWLVNSILFQIAWFSCAYLQASAVPILVFCVILHFYLSPSKKDDLMSLRLCLFGIIVDQALIILGVFTTNADSIPLWLMLLWSLLVLSLNHSLRFLQQMPIAMVALIGAVAGPLSYTAALTMGAVNSDLPIFNFISAFTITWFFLLPFLVKTNQILLEYRQYEV